MVRQTKHLDGYFTTAIWSPQKQTHLYVRGTWIVHLMCVCQCFYCIGIMHHVFFEVICSTSHKTPSASSRLLWNQKKIIVAKWRVYVNSNILNKIREKNTNDFRMRSTWTIYSYNSTCMMYKCWDDREGQPMQQILDVECNSNFFAILVFEN